MLPNVRSIAYLIVCLLLHYVRCEFTSHFQDFLNFQYGREMERTLERLDMGLLQMGSFGGKLDSLENVTNRVGFLMNL